MSDNDELLWRYIDGDLSPEERAQVEEQLATHPDMLELYQKLFRFHLGCRQRFQKKPKSDSDSIEDFISGIYRSAN